MNDDNYLISANEMFQKINNLYETAKDTQILL